MADMSSLSVPAIAAVFGGAVLVIGAFFSGIVSVITAIKVAKIEAHVNSEKTAQQGRETNLQNEINLLRTSLADQKATAGLLAQAVASRGRLSGTGQEIA